MKSFINFLFFSKEETIEQALLRYIKIYESEINQSLEEKSYGNFSTLKPYFEKRWNAYVLKSNKNDFRTIIGNFVKYNEEKYNNLERAGFANFLVMEFQKWLLSHNVDFSEETTAQTMINILSVAVNNSNHLSEVFEQYKVMAHYSCSNELEKMSEIFLNF